MDRRTFLENMAVGAFGASLADLRRAGEYAASISPQQPFEFFKPEQARLLDAVTAQIVPTDETPGAREAHVVRFADHAFATFLKGQGPVIVGALDALDRFSRSQADKQAFEERTPPDQLRVLQAFEKKHNDSFGTLRQLTMAGMFSHPEHGGNFDRTGWKLIGYEDRYSWAPPFGFYDR